MNRPLRTLRVYNPGPNGQSPFEDDYVEYECHDIKFLENGSLLVMRNDDADVSGWVIAVHPLGQYHHVEFTLPTPEEARATLAHGEQHAQEATGRLLDTLAKRTLSELPTSSKLKN